MSRRLAPDTIRGTGQSRTENDIRDLAEARIVVETETAALCARYGEKRDFDVLAKLHDQMMEAAGGERKSLALDIAFHGAVAEGSRNTILTQFLHNIRTKLEEYIVKSLHVPHSADQAIPDAIRSRDVLRARMGMRFHLLVFAQACSIICRIGGAESRALFA